MPSYPAADGGPETPPGAGPCAADAVAPLPAPSPAPAGGDAWLVACLCAAWCDTCRAYEQAFAAAGDRTPRPADGLQWAWIDIEDHDEALGGLDVDNFPTLLVARGERVLFYGTVLPHAATLERLVEQALQQQLPPAAAAPPDLVGRVRAIARR